MNAVSRSRVRSTLQLAVLAGLALAALETPGCGGIATDTAGTHHDGGVIVGLLDSGVGAFGGGARSGGGAAPGIGIGKAGTGGRTITASRCGNGVLDIGEACDGVDLGGMTCSSATLGMSPNGTIRCTSACTVDTTQCYGSGAAGGTTSVGGAGGMSGCSNGAGGGCGTPPDVCYAMLGVPSPKQQTTCLFGQQATQACLYENGTTGGNTNVPTCGAGCGCANCASTYAQCVNTPGCLSVVQCGSTYSCYDSYSCYNAGCQGTIDSYGGLGSTMANDADGVMKCLSGYSCQFTCPTPQPVPL